MIGKFLPERVARKRDWISSQASLVWGNVRIALIASIGPRAGPGRSGRGRARSSSRPGVGTRRAGPRFATAGRLSPAKARSPAWGARP